MPETCENWLGLVNSCVYYAHQTREIYQVLPYSMDFKAPVELWNPPVKTRRYLVNVVLFAIKDLQTSEKPARLKRNLYVGPVNSYVSELFTLIFYLFLPWWRHQMETFFALLTLCAGNSPVPVNSPHKGQWRAALMFSLICARINDWVNNREAGDLRRHRGLYDVNVMQMKTLNKR